MYNENVLKAIHMKQVCHDFWRLIKTPEASYEGKECCSEDFSSYRHWNGAIYHGRETNEFDI